MIGCSHFPSFRLPGDFWEAYDSSEMALNPDMAENTRNKKQVNFKRIRLMNEGEWKRSEIESAVKSALDFTEVSSKEVEFSLARGPVER